MDELLDEDDFHRSEKRLRMAEVLAHLCQTVVLRRLLATLASYFTILVKDFARFARCAVDRCIVGLCYAYPTNLSKH